MVRFTPDLAAGRYEVRFHEATPFGDTKFNCRVRCVKGDQGFADVAPQRAKSLGTFEFAEGTAGFVEISAAGSRAITDAVEFRRIN
jgi:hypothetical protein